jgi:hypothetical protein
LVRVDKVVEVLDSIKTGQPFFATLNTGKYAACQFVSFNIDLAVYDITTISLDPASKQGTVDKLGKTRTALDESFDCTVKLKTFGTEHEGRRLDSEL